MARDLISRYIWLVDILNRYGKLTREEIDRLWMRSPLGDGAPIPPRTFFHYRRAIEENFHIDILCNRRGEYYIDQGDDEHNRSFTNWLLDSYAVSSALRDSQTPAGRVLVEDVPSAREFLPMVLEAIGASEKVRFTYAGFNRSRPETDILFHPYFVKRYKQRWYMVGLREKSNDIRTYALDRVKAMVMVSERFEMPEEMDPATFFDNIIGITLSKAAVRTVKIRTTPQQAKYFRALPFHPTQQEEIHDSYSIFTYKLKLNYELVHEILGFGTAVTVLAPRELRVMVTDELRNSLANYDEPFITQDND
ncbi:MAG: WYL domain-containing protein [Muribaculaceae bacterium]|nr:WYL domain-containing protein [Muribaculaceae bacterium]